MAVVVEVKVMGGEIVVGGEVVAETEIVGAKVVEVEVVEAQVIRTEVVGVGVANRRSGTVVTAEVIVRGSHFCSGAVVRLGAIVPDVSGRASLGQESPVYKSPGGSRDVRVTVGLVRDCYF